MVEAPPPFTIEPLGARHDRKSFRCGVDALDRYLASQVGQDIKRRVSACFVAVEHGKSGIAGYYTIASTSLPLSDVSPDVAKKLPRYPLLPAVRIGRLAVAGSHRGQGLGAGLLVDGIARACRADIAAFAVVVDAKDAAAAAFYEHHGFVAFQGQPLSLYLPLAEAARQMGLSVP